MNSLIQKSFFVLKFRYFRKWQSNLRVMWYKCLGMHIGKNVSLANIYTTWPNQIILGDDCLIEQNVYFKYDGIWNSNRSIVLANKVFVGAGCEFNINSRIEIGEWSNIASGCKFIDHDHGISKSNWIGPQSSVKAEIIIEEDVWLGFQVIVLKGVRIGKGAVVGAGSVVTKSIPSYEIWAGVPARKIGQRS